MPIHQQRASKRIYESLDVYEQLNMDPDHLYYAISDYRLTKKQLKDNGFPGYCDSRQSVPKSQLKRDCIRCYREFHLTEAGGYPAQCDPCYYHPKKVDYPAATYKCCGLPVGTGGCEFSPKHVTIQHSEDQNLTKIRSKRQLKKDHVCGVYALDCEMSYTTGGLEVTKVGLVGINGKTIYECFVKPEHEVLDYNTAFSGVTANDLKSATNTIQDVRAFLDKMLNQDSVLIGHALENDLRALKMIHETVVDTSVMFAGDKKQKRSLKSLALEVLGKNIQDGEHNCIDDARTAMELVLWKVKQSRPDPMSYRPGHLRPWENYRPPGPPRHGFTVEPPARRLQSEEAHSEAAAEMMDKLFGLAYPDNSPYLMTFDDLSHAIDEHLGLFLHRTDNPAFLEYVTDVGTRNHIALYHSNPSDPMAPTLVRNSFKRWMKKLKLNYTPVRCYSEPMPIKRCEPMPFHEYNFFSRGHFSPRPWVTISRSPPPQGQIVSVTLYNDWD